MCGSPRSFVRAVGLLVALTLVGLVAGCGSKASDAGGNFRLSGDQLQPTTTTTAPPATTTTAEAAGAELEVFSEKPGEAGLPTAVPAAFAAGAVQPIPRPGLAYDFAQATPTGWRYKNPTYFGSPLVMVVTSVEGDWVKVSIPARPNGQQGWVRASDVKLAQHQFHAELVLSERLFTVWNGNTPVAQTNVVVGKDNTPTPLGTLYIAEKLPASVAGVSPGGAYGPFILATSAYSEALDVFDDGLPVIAFHGTNQPDLIGSASSNGCIRMPNDIVTLLAETIPAGTPVTIRE
jgi:lipoprotein-anchoring transpeptidase ErfK/SrfK